MPKRENTTHDTQEHGNTIAAVTPMPGNTATSIEGSEDYDALNIVETYKHEITYCIERGKWLHWNGHVWEWQPQDGGYVRELARQYARTITPENSKQETWKSDPQKQWHHRPASLASTDRRIARKAEEYDAHP